MVHPKDVHTVHSAALGPLDSELTSVLSVSDGGTAWVSQESFEADEPDSRAGVKWKNVARQLKEDLSSIILLSEEDLQVSLLHSPRHSPASTGQEP